MTTNPTVWGVHMGVHVGDGPINGGYVAIGASGPPILGPRALDLGL